MFNLRAKQSSSAAVSLNELSGTRSLKGFIGRQQKSSLFQFSLSNRSSVSFSLTKLKANADLKLLNANRVQIAGSKKPGKQSEQVALTLEPGTYYLRVNVAGGAETRYTLTTTQSSAVVPSAGGGTALTNGGGGISPSMGGYLPGRSPADYAFLVSEAYNAADNFYNYGTPSEYEKFTGINSLLFSWASAGDKQAADAYALALSFQSAAYALSIG